MLTSSSCNCTLFTAQYNTEDKLAERTNFDEYDANKDGYLDKSELREWALPTQQEAAEDEAEHLMTESDADGDGKLTRDEILAQYELWVGSAVTDYGNSLHDPSEL